MRCYKISILLALIANITFASTDTRFCIISPGYNTANYYQELIESVASQDYHNWHMVIIDDHSSDNSAELIAAYLKKHELSGKIKLIANSENLGALANFYHSIHQYCADNEVVVTLDGDDLLANQQVLSKLAQVYRNEQVWLTYGSFDFYVEAKDGWRVFPFKNCGNKVIEEFVSNRQLYKALFAKYYFDLKNKFQAIGLIDDIKPACKLIPSRDIPKKVLEYSAIRSEDWYLWHLRAFRMGVFKKIELKDLLYEGQFMTYSQDAALLYPMVEMAALGHVQFIPEILYLYRQRELNDYKVHYRQQTYIALYLCSLKPYQPL